MSSWNLLFLRFGQLVATCIVISLVEINSVTGKTYYCEDGQVEITDNSGAIHTVREGSTNYDNNMDCTWVIRGPNPTDNVFINVTSSNLAWAPESAICNGYDYVEVRTSVPSEEYDYDRGQYFDEDILVSWCGKRNPLSLVTKGNVAYINFKTNDRNTGNYQFDGVKLDFQIISRPPPNGACPPGWTMGPDPVKGPHCYSLKKHEETWKRAQEFCSYNQANLVSFVSEKEANFVSDMVKPEYRGRQRVWIGLNDLSVNSEYKWMENKELSIKPRWAQKPHNPNIFHNCIYMTSHDGKWSEDSCAESDVVSLIKYPFVCKKNAKDNTTVYLVPQERIEKENKGNLPPKAAIIAGVVAGCLFVLAICAFIYFKFYRTKEQQCSSESTPNEAISLDTAARARPATQRQTEPPRYSPPPSYHEVAATELPQKDPAAVPDEAFL